jgi:hypothetical protein
MADDPSIGPDPFETLKDQGATPRDVYREARRRGLGKMEAIRVVRGLFQLSFVEAREVSWAVDGYPSYMIPPIESCKELVGVLEEELGYCGCAYYDDAILVLRETLEVARDRRDTFGKEGEGEGTWARTGEALRAGLCIDEAPGLATWFLYFLDHRGFVEHAGNLMGCWITDKGLRLLDGIRAYYPPPEELEQNET